MIVAKYKFNPSTYTDLLPVFNTEFTSYTKSDTTNSDGTITRTIESSSLPTLMTFGTVDETYTRSGSLLEILDMNTSNLTSMQRMFRYCINLTNITCNWNTSKVTNMKGMFSDCRALTLLDVSKFDTSNVTNMGDMFAGCLSLTTLNVSSWNTSNVTDISGMFNDCSSLRKIKMINATIPQLTDILPIRTSDNVGYLLSLVSIPNDKNWEALKFSHNEVYLPQPLRKIGDVKDRFYWDYDKGYYCIEQNVSDNLEVLSSPNIIDLPEMNKKFTFDTYLPNTNVKVTNLPIQPYSLLLKDDTVRYKATIEPSTLYTIQFNCLAKPTTNLTLDLGGTRVTVEPIIGVNHVQITTPNILASDRLFLIGTGIVIREVIVNKGNMNQYTKYFDGEQGVGELQEDGSYIIRISTDNYTGLWEGDL